MRFPGRTIWDTRVQSVCGVLSVKGDSGVEIFVSASFAQVSLNPPLVIVNPNRMHSVEPAIDLTGRFAINVMPVSARDVVASLMKMRRRQPDKAQTVGLKIAEDEHQIPFVEGALRVVFCEVENTIPSGDRRLYIARVLESRLDGALAKQRPLLFSDVQGNQSASRPRKLVRKTLIVSGALDAAKKLRNKLRPPAPPNIALTTYEVAGATEEEIELINQYGVVDRSRILKPAAAPAIVTKRIGVCVVGTGWGGVHCRYLKMASPSVRLFVCGRNAERTTRLARSVGAEGVFTDLRTAAEDKRVQALTLALPHDIHRQAAETAIGARKHVLVEKPIATNLSDADAMIAAARKAGTILMVAEDMHFRPAVREAVACINRGDVGEPLYLLAHAGGIRRPTGWAAEKDRMGGGVLIDIGVHYIRGLRLLMGEPDRVFATRAMQVNTKMMGEDSVQLLFESRFGWQAHMLLTWSSQRGDVPDFVLAGDDGTLHLWPGRSYIDYYPAASRFLPQAISYVRPYSLQEKLFRPWMNRVRLPIKDADVTGYLGEMKEFIAAVAEERTPASVADDGRRDLEIVLRSYEALAAGTWIDLPNVL
jgi:predicted dehydrogenase/flavin reductase (DIM6/NTAB) family NADH-FMN oxidoreductase RutF